jgi:excisionase family DNA binding protein
MGLKQPMSEKQIFTTMEAAQYLGVSYSTMRTWIKDDLIPHETLPCRENGVRKFFRIRKSALDMVLNNQREQQVNA